MSPYTITNKTGYSLEIRKEQDQNSIKSVKKLKDHFKDKDSFSDKKFYVDNNSSISFQIENDESYFFDTANIKNISNSLKISVQIKHTLYKPINDINIQRIHVKEHKVYGGKEAFKITTDVIFDAETNKKILTISSTVLMRNITQRIIEIQFLTKPESFILILNPFDKIPVPFDMISEAIRIKFNDIKEWSLPNTLFNIYAKNSSFQIHILDKYINIRSEDENKFNKILTFEPPFRLKNCLPLSLKIKLNYDDNGYSPTKNDKVNSIFLEPQDSYDMYDIPFETILYCQILIQGYKWSNTTQINSSIVPEKLLFKIYDERGFEQSVILHCFMTNNGARKFYFYSKAYIINESYFNLWLFTNFEKRKQPIPGQKRLIYKEERNDKILLLHEETNLLICEQNCMEETSKEISLEVLNNTLVEFKTMQGFIQMAINMNMLCIGLNFFFFFLKKSKCKKFQIKRNSYIVK